MDINTYLHYNNVALIDPSEEFHASCIKQFNTKGYLTPNQLLSLRNWAHSTDTIKRLIAGLSEATPAETPIPTEASAPTTPPTKSRRWTGEEVLTLLAMVEEGTTSIAALAKAFNRKESSIRGILYKNSEECTLKKGQIIQFSPLPF